MTAFLFGCSLFPTISMAANENLAQNHFTQGNALFQKGDYENALNEYQEALKATDSKNHPEVTFNQSMALYKLGKTAEADALYSIFIKTENERLLNKQRLERSLFDHLFTPESQGWPNRVAKNSMYVVGLVLIAIIFKVALDGGTAFALFFILPITVGFMMTAYFL
jgi:tetratricopeptide (TPR) repeat protein